jgi:uncharacterized sulfatase
VLISGLYSQQSWLAVTILATPDARVSLSPVLNRAYPTYGKLLKAAGYQTPYVGKWHASVPPQNPQRYLKAYGFDGMTLPDPTGSNLQGTVGNEQEGYLNDQDIADQAVSWLSKRSAGDQPWCLTVSFVNPHDKEFFWGGTEFKTFNDLYDQPRQKLKPFTFYSFNDGKKYPPFVPWAKDPLKSPRSYGYPALPPNWESLDKLKRTKPSTQAGVRQFSELVWGGVSDDPKADAFTIAPYPVLPDTYGIAYAPYHYWRRNLDSYTQIIQIVDERIGEVLSALPKAVADDTIIVFTSDHGEYAGAHGFVSGKVGSLYDEAYHVPLIVVDPTGRFTGDIDKPRDGLTSSVDMLAMLVSLGFGGSRKWMVGPLADLYGRRHDMLPMLRSAKAAGRDHVLLATDEQAPAARHRRAGAGLPGRRRAVPPPRLAYAGLQARRLQRLEGRHDDRYRLDRDRVLRLRHVAGPCRGGQHAPRPARGACPQAAAGRDRAEGVPRPAAGRPAGTAGLLPGALSRLLGVPQAHQLQGHPDAVQGDSVGPGFLTPGQPIAVRQVFLRPHHG